MKLARRLDQSFASRAKTLRRLAVKDQFRRGLLAERLEERSLLASDVISGFLASTPSPYYNANLPVDVTNDLRITPMDALTVINALNAGGIRQLPAEVAEGENRQFIDVNNDRALTPRDALEVINYLNAEGAPPDLDDKVRYIFVAVRLGGDPTNAADVLGTFDANGDLKGGTISNGQQFDLVMMAQDLRPEGEFEDPARPGEFLPLNRYVFQAYADISYNDTLTPVSGTEVQNLAVSGPTTGTLTLVDPVLGINVTTTSINFNMANTTARGQTAAAVETALNAQLGAGSVVVTASGTSNLRVRFTGTKFVNTEVALLTTTAGTITVTEFRKADPNDPGAFSDAMIHSNEYASGPFERDAPNLLDDLGGFSAMPFATTILDPIEVVRVRMIAVLPQGQQQATQVFTTNFPIDPLNPAAYPNMDTGHETTLIGNLAADPPENSEVNPSEINWNTVTLTIVGGPVNAVPDTDTVAEDTAGGVLINVLGNDTVNPPAAPPIQLRSVTQPATGGTVAIEGTSVRFTPALNFAGTATFTYNASVAGSSEEATGTVTVTVTAVNDAPTLDAIGNQNINEDVDVTVNLTGIGPGGGADEANQTVTITATSSNPTLLPNPVVTYTSPGATGSLLLAPVDDQSGSATVTVTASDGTTTTVRTFTVNVAPVNDAPVNRKAGVAISGGTTIVAPTSPFPITDLSVSDVDSTSLTTTLTLTGVASPGTLTLGSQTGTTITLNGTPASISTQLAGLVYNAGTDFTATLTMTTTDNVAPPVVSTITISRDPGIARYPFALDLQQTVLEGTPSVTVDVIAQAFKEPGAITTITSANLAAGSQGTVDISTGQVVYTPPNADFFTQPGSPIQIVYVIDDDSANTTGSLDDRTGTISITITNVNDTPVGVTDTVDAQSGVNNIITSASLVQNDTDVDNDPLTAVNPVMVSGPGSISVNSSGDFVFTSASTGTSTFTYQARDPSGALSAATTVTVRISGPASATNDTATTAEDTVFNSTTSVLANDDDGDPLQDIPLTATLVSNVPASAGSVTLQSNGQYTYNPAANFSGTTSFTYTANAGAKVSNVATVTITVTETNDPPTAVNDTFLAVRRSGTAPNEVGVNQPVSVIGNDSIAPDVGETLSVTGIGTSAAGPFSAGPTATTGGGSVRIVGGQILYDSPTTAGSDSFFYELTDSRGGKASAQVNVSVVDFVPKVISGTVYVDSDNDGVIDAGERRLAGVDVTLTGTDFTDQAVNITVTTDIDGNYSFGAAGSNVTIKPPKAGTSYTMVETQPAYLLNGLDTSNSTDTFDHDGVAGTPEILSVTNSNRNDSRFVLTWSVTDSGNITGLNFGERGVDVSSLDDASGFIQEYLASSSGNGFVMAADLGGDVLWNWSLPGWENAKSVKVTLSSDLTTLDIECIDGAGHTHTTSLLQTPSNGTQARFRILGVGQNGQYIIRVDGTAIDCGLDLHAAIPAGAAGEGEAAAYAAGADAFFTEQALA